MHEVHTGAEKHCKCREAKQGAETQTTVATGRGSKPTYGPLACCRRW